VLNYSSLHSAAHRTRLV